MRVNKLDASSIPQIKGNQNADLNAQLHQVSQAIVRIVFLYFVLEMPLQKALNRWQSELILSLYFEEKLHHM